MFVAAQLVGFAALAACVISYQFKTYRMILLLQVLTTALFMAHFGLLALSGTQAAWTATVSNAICLIRNLFYYFTRDKHGPFSEKTAAVLKPAFFAVLLIVFGIATWSSIASFFCLMAMLLYTVSFSLSDPQKVRVVSLIGIPFMMIYDVMTGSIAGALNESIAAASTVVGLWRFHRKDPEPVSGQSD
ncbi:MAG: YgjV family protein [Oscillospiraceae bacterium]|nr:YgjV family protein [Oscillospiraceae bacterium]